jgi:hypothetical protein
MGCVVNATPRPLYPRELPGTLCIQGWVGPKARLDGCGKPGPHPDSIPDRPVRRVAIPTALSRPTSKIKKYTNNIYLLRLGVWYLIIDYDYPCISKLRTKQCLWVKNYQTFHRAVVLKLCITNKLKTQNQSRHIINTFSKAIQKHGIIIVIVQFWTIIKSVNAAD